MTERDDHIRTEVWEKMGPDLRDFLADMAFSPAGDGLTPEMRKRIEDNAIKDVVEQEQGE